MTQPSPRSPRRWNWTGAAALVTAGLSLGLVRLAARRAARFFVMDLSHLPEHEAAWLRTLVERA